MRFLTIILFVFLFSLCLVGFSLPISAATPHQHESPSYSAPSGSGSYDPSASSLSSLYSLPIPSQAFIQRPAPSFTAPAVVNGKFETLTLNQFRGKWTVLLFYPLAFTFVCPSEIWAFSDRLAEFHSLNAEVLAISVDSQHALLAWSKMSRKDGGLGKTDIPLVSDLTKRMSQTYGVLLDSEGVALRGLFLIDPKGILRQITINDLPVGRSVDETLRLLKAFQHVEKKGENCPANWQPGADTIKGDPEGAKEFFQKHADL